jgi:hypothetical protein
MQEKKAADRTIDAHRADKLYMESNLLRILRGEAEIAALKAQTSR